jgi:tRNA dimethylallyltransferase
MATMVEAIVISGPTASGKSALAMRLAARLRGEIISMDSAQVYRQMDVGTAKPSAAERAAVPHHLIDILDPAQSYSAADFSRDTRALMAQIQARGGLPMIVGGTMLYLKALTEGLSHLPQADAAVRTQLDADAAVHGWPAMHARLAALDPVTAARLAPNDKQRIQRALEICLLTGQPMSSLLQAAPPTPLRLLHVSVEPPRELRWQRIEARLDVMLAAGLVDEVRQLRARGDLHADLPSIRCVGYRQVWEALDDLPPGAALTGAPLADARDRALFATRQLAKRQMTWLRSMPQRVVLPGLDLDADEAATLAAISEQITRP